MGVLTPNGTPKYVFGNREFIQNAVDYLLGDHSLIAIRSKTITLRLLDNEKAQQEKAFWKFMNIAFPLFFITLLGILFNFLRKRKYAK
jgi:ABC-type uncharacterized transport system involved in gliding motility auxiliary subunit